MITPDGGFILPNIEIEVGGQPSRTYRVDENGSISGMVDGLEAIKQAAYKVLLTERYETLIYSADYGSELKGLVGQETAFIRSELKRRITEALLQDDRIHSVDDFSVSFVRDTAILRFSVSSDFGDFTVEQEVSGIV